MDFYNVTFVADWGHITTTVNAADGEKAVDVARDYLYSYGEVPWGVLCLMRHVESEYVGSGVL